MEEKLNGFEEFEGMQMQAPSLSFGEPEPEAQAQVQAKPETAPRLRKLMNYYLPTTTKLLDAYIELDRQDEPGENVRTTKREIESALDTINKAFENLLDSMFQDMAWDISSDISVMKSMLDQDGLTERELRAGGKPEEKEEKKEEEGQVQQLVF